MAKKQEDNRDVFEVAADDVAGTGPYPHKRKRLPKEQEEKLSEALAAFTPIAVGALAGGAIANKAAKRFGKPRGQSQKAYEAASADDRFWATGMGGFAGGSVGAGISGQLSQKKKRRK